MKLNSHVKIVGKKVILIPYEKHHVPKYHEWMKSEELQILTASEPLTLDQEYNMQKSWRADDDKCTFIILEKEMYDKNLEETEAMIGDINIFITDKEMAIGEIEIMIAEKTARGKKMGWEAVILMLMYGIKNINIKTFESKILLKNSISIRMFEKLGFQEKTKSAIFQEVTLEKKVCDEWLKWLEEQIPLEIQQY